MICVAPRSYKSDQHTHPGRTEEDCCECGGGRSDDPIGLCVYEPDIHLVPTSDSDSSPVAPQSPAVGSTDENHCTAIMEFARCGSDEDIRRCAFGENTTDYCSDCRDDAPYPMFQFIGSESPRRAQNLCIDANRYGCTYVFRRQARDDERCISGMCAGNTEFPGSESDWICEGDSTLVPDAENTPGRDSEICCEKTGLCQGNTDETTDVACTTPKT